MPFALDSSFIVAFLSLWHPKNKEVVNTFESLRHQASQIILPGPALTEAYSILTGNPPQHRTSPSVALKTLTESFLSRTTIIILSAEEYIEVVKNAAKSGITGGAIHDAIIAQCARKGGATKILTLNYRHFIRFAGNDLEIIVPEV